MAKVYDVDIRNEDERYNWLESQSSLSKIPGVDSKVVTEHFISEHRKWLMGLTDEELAVLERFGWSRYEDDRPDFLWTVTPQGAQNRIVCLGYDHGKKGTEIRVCNIFGFPLITGMFNSKVYRSLEFDGIIGVMMVGDDKARYVVLDANTEELLVDKQGITGVENASLLKAFFESDDKEAFCMQDLNDCKDEALIKSLFDVANRSMQYKTQNQDNTLQGEGKNDI